MKRVLHVMQSLERSGMEMMLLSSYAEWRLHGYECDVVATAAAIGPVALPLRDSGYGVYHIPFRSKLRYLPRASFVRDFYRLCKSGYDVVHIHTEAGRPAYAVLAKLAGVRRIAVTPHNTFAFRGALRVRKFLERHLILLLGGRVGFISEAVRQCEWDRFRVKGVRISNWLDTSHFRSPSTEERAGARESLGIREDEFVIVSVGNCNPAKNHSAILHALLLLPAAILPLYLHVGNELPDAPERKLARELSLTDKVRFLGSQVDPLTFLWAADVFVMPSLNEGLSIAAVEAIASGAPVLLANVAGLSEIAKETNWAVLTSTTAESVAQGLLKIAATEPMERRRRAIDDSQLIRDRYSVRSGVNSVIIGLYE